MHSILSQLEYKYQVDYWDQRGVPFKRHVYVPEIHPKTHDEFHEREDDAHVLKVSHIVCIQICKGMTFFQGGEITLRCSMYMYVYTCI